MTAQTTEPATDGAPTVSEAPASTPSQAEPETPGDSAPPAASTPSSTMPSRPSTDTGTPTTTVLGPQQARAQLAAGCQGFYNGAQRRWYTLCGRILDKYNEFGGPSGVLGDPTSDELTNPDGIGKRTSFANNSSIYWHPDTDAHQIGGEIGGRWAGLGWEGSPLGYPTTDELTNPDGVGKRNWFRGGAIYWHPSFGAWNVWGDILTNWGSRGYERGRFGYPSSSEFDFNGGKAQNFASKTIDWRPGDPIAPSDYKIPWSGSRREAVYPNPPIDAVAARQQKASPQQDTRNDAFDDPDGTTLPEWPTTCGVWSDFPHPSQTRDSGALRYPAQIHTQSMGACTGVTTGLVTHTIDVKTARLRWWGVPVWGDQVPFAGKKIGPSDTASRTRVAPSANKVKLVSAIDCEPGTFFRYATEAHGTATFSGGQPLAATSWDETKSEVPCLK